jgi:DnaJ-class molecular chaperone
MWFRKYKKRIISCLVSLVICLSFVACAGETSEKETSREEASIVSQKTEGDISIPEEMAVITFDDYPFSQILRPKLSVVNIDVFDGILGCDLKINCIDDSEITIRVPELTEPNHTFTIKSKGMPNVNNNNVVGDMKVIVKYKMPKSLSNNQRELLKKVKDKC